MSNTSNIKSIEFYNNRGQEDSEGNRVSVSIFDNVDLTIEEQNTVFDKLLPLMKQTMQIYYYIEMINTDKDDVFVYDDTSLAMAKRLDRTQEIKDLVDTWLDEAE